eukprot:Trichotokara_eunicae@DN5471_c0_g1_i1.p1
MRIRIRCDMHDHCTLSSSAFAAIIFLISSCSSPNVELSSMELLSTASRTNVLPSTFWQRAKPLVTRIRLAFSVSFSFTITKPGDTRVTRSLCLGKIVISPCTLR